jgi:hypothetical protein
LYIVGFILGISNRKAHAEVLEVIVEFSFVGNKMSFPLNTNLILYNVIASLFSACPKSKVATN